MLTQKTPTPHRLLCFVYDIASQICPSVYCTRVPANVRAPDVRVDETAVPRLERSYVRVSVDGSYSQSSQSRGD